MHESPDETVLDLAVAKALLAEVEHARKARKPVFTIPAEAQVKRLIAAAWPVLAEHDIDLIVGQTDHAVHGGWEVRCGYIICAWDGERIAEALGDGNG